MGRRINVFVDIDNTIYNSTKAVVKYLNAEYDTDVDYRNVKGYDFKDEFPQLAEGKVEQIFDDPLFYFQPECVNYDALSYLNLLDDFKECNINFVTLGTTTNLENKRLWIDKTCAIDKYITGKPTEYIEFYGSTNKESDKSFVDMSDGIFIDDNIDCLRSSNAKIKILLKNNIDTRWNKLQPNEDIYVVNNWEEIFRIIDFFYENRGMM